MRAPRFDQSYFFLSPPILSELQISVDTAGPQLRAPDVSVGTAGPQRRAPDPDLKLQFAVGKARPQLPDLMPEWNVR